MADAGERLPAAGVALPPPLRADLDAFLTRLAEERPDCAELLSDPRLEEAAPRVLAASEFVQRRLLAPQADLAGLAGDGSLFRDREPGETAAALEQALAGSSTPLAVSLRRFRQREMLRIAWRDLAGWAALGDVLEELSALADAALLAALDGAREAVAGRHGELRSASGRPIPLTVLAMGKLGGRELNFSSDIDVVFLYPEEGESDGARPLSAAEYHTRLARRVIALLDEVTAEGFVFRVDTRLRPFGDSGPLVVSFAALENYLQQHGRDWERYAYLKARIVGHALPPDAARDLECDVLRPFVYRRYLDFGVFDSLREMKRMIEREVARRELADNLKRGPGGIREIEFIVQAWQLVRGGSEPALQSRELEAALAGLARRGHLTRATELALREAYRFLRRAENRLQAIADRQTHDLPADDLGRARLACAMGYGRWDDFRAALDGHRDRVTGEFAALLAGPEERGSAVGEALATVWDPERGVPDDLAARLAEAGLEQTEALAEALAGLARSGTLKRLDEPSRQRLAAFVPALLARLAGRANAARSFARLARIVEAVARRSAYLSLLLENPEALSRLIEIAEMSGVLASEIARHPVLLDELIDPRLYGAPPDRAALAAELEGVVATHDDLEQRVEALARFQRIARFRVAVADIAGTLALMKVSDRLTDIAELVIAAALELAWEDLTAGHGTPRCVHRGQRRRAGFAVVAYGKLGGIELAYASDLDLVFLHDSGGEKQRSDGAKPLANDVFFARLAQRLQHFLTVQTGSGALYEIDTRLRPSGRSGLLVSSLDAFERYQRNDAWTWEHQALIRARPVAGSAGVCRRFEAVRAEVLRDHVERDGLREEVLRMRERMRRELSKSGAGEFDIKQDRGGLGELEFLVQYLILRDAGRHPALSFYTDNVRQLGVLAAVGALQPQTARELQDIYRGYRARLHRLALDELSRVVPDSEFREERERVDAVWTDALGQPG